MPGPAVFRKHGTASFKEYAPFSLKIKNSRMKKLFRTLFAAALCCLTFKATDACTNFIITRGASSDGSVMVSYAADSHPLYGALYKPFSGRYTPGPMLPV